MAISAIKWPFSFPPHPTSASALPREKKQNIAFNHFGIIVQSKQYTKHTRCP